MVIVIYSAFSLHVARGRMNEGYNETNLYTLGK